MSNPHLEFFKSDAPHIIFVGRNALTQAIVYDRVGRIGTPDELYALRVNQMRIDKRLNEYFERKKET